LKLVLEENEPIKENVEKKKRAKKKGKLILVEE